MRFKSGNPDELAMKYSGINRKLPYKSKIVTAVVTNKNRPPILMSIYMAPPVAIRVEVVPATAV